jgi:hypothetical protein
VPPRFGHGPEQSRIGNSESIGAEAAIRFDPGNEFLLAGQHCLDRIIGREHGGKHQREVVAEHRNLPAGLLQRLADQDVAFQQATRLVADRAEHVERVGGLRVDRQSRTIETLRIRKLARNCAASASSIKARARFAGSCAAAATDPQHSL